MLKFYILQDLAFRAQVRVDFIPLFYWRLIKTQNKSEMNPKSFTSQVSKLGRICSMRHHFIWLLKVQKCISSQSETFDF